MNDWIILWVVIQIQHLVKYMEVLRDLDKIAYVRFASVYRDFQDEEAFFNELKNLMRHKAPEGR